jgi:hypothetical protein
MAERVAGTYDTTQTGYDPARAGDVAVAIAGRRISWGAVFASVIIVLIVQFVLSLLGVGIGASTINPLERGGTPEASSFGIGAGIWWLVCSLISVFAGAWVAGRLAGMPDRTDGMLHGLVAWGLAMLLLIYLLTTAVSNLVGGAFGVVGSAMQTVGQGAQEAAGAARTGVLAPFQQDLQQLLGQARQQAQQAGQQIQQVASDETVRQVVQKAVTAGPENLSEADRQAAINALAQHTGMTRPEAEQRLAQWQQSYQQAKQQALQTAQVTADAVSRASLWSFVALVLGAIVAAIGGMLGATRKVAYARA